MLRDYGTFTDAERSMCNLLSESDALPELRCQIGKRVTLIDASAGFEPAGSVARWTDGYYAVRFDYPSGGIGGRRYKRDADGLTAARAHFAKLTVSA